MKKLIVFAIAILGFSGVSFGQGGTIVNSSAGATIVTPLTITNSTPLNFGTSSGNTVGTRTVILAVDNSRTGTADLIGSDGAAGVFAVTGANSTPFSILLPTDVTIIKTGGADMHITSWVHDNGNNPTTSGAGAATIKVGATLTLNIGQAAGIYTGNYDVTINYN